MPCSYICFRSNDVRRTTPGRDSPEHQPQDPAGEVESATLEEEWLELLPQDPAGEVDSAAPEGERLELPQEGPAEEVEPAAAEGDSPQKTTEDPAAEVVFDSKTSLCIPVLDLDDEGSICPSIYSNPEVKGQRRSFWTTYQKALQDPSAKAGWTIRWGRIQTIMERVDPEYRHWTAMQIKAKALYLRKNYVKKNVK